jgi:hypothetical protein
MRRAFARTALLCAIALTVLPLATAHATTKYDMVKQFSIKQNPAGVWSYWDDNYSSPLPYAHRNYRGIKGFQCWSNKRPYVNQKVTICVNKTGQTITLDKGNFVFPPGYVMLSPENYGNAYVQFTALSTGTYTVKGRYIPLALKEAHKNNAYIERFGSEDKALWFGKVDGHGAKRFDLTVPLQQGDTLHFLLPQDDRKEPNYVGVTAVITGP